MFETVGWIALNIKNGMKVSSIEIYMKTTKITVKKTLYFDL
jgi:hypothetical protein